ncbi:MAG: hypothetical protein ACYSSI_07610 [Planctomycetota bacterium]
MAYSHLSGGTMVRIYNDSGETIPANSFAMIKASSPYDHWKGYFKVTKPDADNLPWSRLVVVTEEIPSGKAHYGYVEGIFVVKMTSGESFAAGDKCGSDANAWTAIEVDDDGDGNNDGQFYVVDVVDTNYLIIRSRMVETLVIG